MTQERSDGESKHRARVGFDAPKAGAAEDRLSRVHFARMIYRVAAETNRDWSVRVGVHGAWGEGKTTVLNFVREMAVRDGHLIVDINAWEHTELATFRAAVVDGLLPAVSLVKSLPVRISRLIGRASHVLERGGSIAGGGLKALPAGAPFADLAQASASVPASVVRDWGRSPTDLLFLQQQLRERRALVFVDDIDRADPAMLPRLFFLLREGMDIPGLSFVLAFDRRRVRPVLQQAHPGFDTDEFLDKIIDFPFHLPALSREKKLVLAQEEVATLELPVPPDAVKATLDLFPDSPRRVRLLLRKMMALAPEIRRHDPDELNPVLLLHVHLLMETAPTFAARLFGDHDFQRQVMRPGRLFRNLRPGGEAEPEGEVKALISSALADEPFAKEELEEKLSVVTRILTAMGNNIFAYVPEQLAYYAALGTEPHAVTNKEFRAVFARWDDPPSSTAIRTWAESQGKAQEATTQAVLREMINAATNEHTRRMEAAAQQGAVAAQQANVTEAQKALRCIDVIAFELGGLAPAPSVEPGWLTPAAALSLRASLSRFAQLRDPVYQGLRQEEELLLERVLTSESLDPAEMLKGLERHERPTLAREHASEDLRQRVITVLRARLANIAISALGKPDGLQRLARQWDKDLFDELMFSATSPLWNAPREPDVLAVIATAAGDDAVFENVFSLLANIGSRGGMHPLIRAKPAIVRKLWAAASSRRMNRRWVGSLEELRQQLNGHLRQVENTQGPDLEVPDWWDEALAGD